ncbi:MAG: hydroxyacid dehydrogenase [Desulfobacterales bacterium]|nr:MAG: hydroxyacid dehydrogenase [Desulfobacterales bacterium]
MKRINILNAEPLGYSAEAGAVLSELGNVVAKEMSRSQLLREVSDFDVLIVRLANQIDRELIGAGRRLRAIVTATTGLDHIDVAYARQQGIAVLSLRGETDFLQQVQATAEHTWALLLALMRNIVPASIAARQGQWDRDKFRGHELFGQRLGIVGLGRLGQKVARYGQAFGMRVAAYDPLVEEWLEGVRRKLTLTDLLKKSDILSLHVPLNTETEGMIGAAQLALLPAGAVLVNTSRGRVIDESALIKALTNRHLAGAALDVVAFERDTESRMKSPLFAYARNHDNLLITPHIGGATYESMAQTELFMAHKLKKFLLEMDKDQKVL